MAISHFLIWPLHLWRLTIFMTGTLWVGISWFLPPKDQWWIRNSPSPRFLWNDELDAYVVCECSRDTLVSLYSCEFKQGMLESLTHETCPCHQFLRVMTPPAHVIEQKNFFSLSFIHSLFDSISPLTLLFSWSHIYNEALLDWRSSNNQISLASIQYCDYQAKRGP